MQIFFPENFVLFVFATGPIVEMNNAPFYAVVVSEVDALVELLLAFDLDLFKVLLKLDCI